MSEKLKPCPWCKEEPTILQGTFNSEWAYCYHCKIIKLLSDWNHRPIEDALRATLQELTDAEKEIRKHKRFVPPDDREIDKIDQAIAEAEEVLHGEYVVNNWVNCPLYNVYCEEIMEGNCSHPFLDEEHFINCPVEIKRKYVIPDDCPLRKGPITIRIGETE